MTRTEPSAAFRPSRRRHRLTAAALATVAALALAGCQSTEERAENHYQSALELLAAGDQERAIVEFRNVFRYNGFHREARQTYAGLLIERGQAAEGYSQYLRLVEQYPDALEARLRLAELAFARTDWPETERHGRAAIELAAGDPRAQVLAAALAYRTATLDKDEAARAEAVTEARNLRAALADRPESLAIAQRLIVDHLATSQTPMAALPEIDRALDADPDSFDYHRLRLQLLAQAGDTAAIGEQLRAMFARFPDDRQVQEGLVSFYISQDDMAGAEAVLRDLAGEATGPIEGHATLVQFLGRTRGAEAARAELDRLVAAAAGHANAGQFRALRAALDFEQGDRAPAVAAMEEVLRDAPPSDETNRIKVALARMLAITGDAVGARARIEEVLAEDARNVEALKMRAGWAIEEDRPGPAIVDLRAALDQAPRDPEVMTLMAAAHERDGARELAGERLALAVEVSGRRAEESLRYARFLAQDNRAETAISVLVDARQVTPADPRLAIALAELYVARRDWSRAREMASALMSLPGEAPAAGEQLAAAILLAEGQSEQGLAALRRLADEGRGNAATAAAIVQTQIAAGRADEARAYIDGAVAAAPGDRDLQRLSASLYAATGDAAAAEREFRALLAGAANDEQTAQLLYGLLAAQGRDAEATQVLEEGIAANPRSMVLGWLRAGELERAGDIDGAIATYERLYAADSGNAVIANNLASLITTHRDDPEGLERAYAIAQRLRSSDVPAFQDTYGWIEFRRGNVAEALSYLEPAARGMPDNALVQYHLGRAYAAAERPAEAKAQLERALDLAGDSPLPQFGEARELLKTLDAAN